VGIQETIGQRAKETRKRAKDRVEKSRKKFLQSKALYAMMLFFKASKGRESKGQSKKKFKKVLANQTPLCDDTFVGRKKDS